VAVKVLAPALLKTIEQLPAPEISDPLQVSPVLAFTVTEPVGVPFPLTVKLTVTACPTMEGLGKFAVMAVVLAA